MNKKTIKNILPQIAILLVLFISLPAFTQQAIMNLPSDPNNQHPTGVYPAGDFFARDKVIMKYPFTTKATDYPSGRFRAYIDESVVVPVTYTDPTIINSSTTNPYTLDNSLVVGTTAGTVDVSLIGAATYNVPIDLPPGTAGMMPSLSVSYNSNAGSGIMGMGWNINGLSAISRVPKTLDMDGIIKEVQFDASDALALDGNRLIDVGGYYGTSLETFSKITIKTDNGLTYYKVETKDGLEIEYGGTSDSRLTHSREAGKIIAYYINKVSDKNHNYYKYTYFNNPATGEFRIQKIDYTSNDDANINSYNCVQFVYEQKSDDQISNKYYLGSLEADNVLLKEIHISSEGQMFHKYVFNYSHNVVYGNPEFVYLTDIQEYGSDNKKYNKTVFNWGTSATNVPADIDCGTYYDNNLRKEYVDIDFPAIPFYGDFDGDGKLESAVITRTCDIPCSNHRYTYSVSIFNGGGPNGSTSVPIVGNVLDYYGAEFLVNPNQRYIGGTADINGDGKDDAVFCSSQLNNSTRTIKLFPLISVADGNNGIYRKFSPGTPIQIDFTDDPSHQPTIETNLMDFNGDGLADLMVRVNKSREIYIFYSNGNTFEHSLQLSNYIYYLPINLGDPQEITLLDYNGDHIIDFIANYSNGLQNRSYLFRGTSQPRTFDIYTNQLDGYFNNKLYVGDFNGDGNSDIFIPQGKLFLFSKASQDLNDISQNLFDFKQDINWNNQSQIDDGSNYYTGDFNGDGKTDIAQYRQNNYTDPAGDKWSNFHVWFNENFSKLKSTYKEIPSWCFISTINDNENRLHYAFPVDVDGDGVTEIKFARFCNTGTGTLQYYLTEGLLDGKNYYPCKITKIANGLNVQTSINYKTGGFGIAPEVGNFTYPMINSFLPLTVVKEISISSGIKEQDGTQKTLKTEYKFVDPRTHLRGKGFLGFTKVMEFHEIAANGNWPTLALSTTEFNYENSYYYPCMTSQKLDYLVITNNNQNNDYVDCNNYNQYHITENNFTTNYYSFNNNPNHYYPYIKETVASQFFYNQINTSESGIGYYNPISTIQETTTYTYDQESGNSNFYGNIANIVSLNGTSTSLTEYTGYTAQGSWCPNKPREQKIKLSRTGQSDNIATTIYTWNTQTGQLSSQISPPGVGNASVSVPSSSQSITTYYEYNQTGNIIRTNVEGTGISDPSEVLQYYDSKNRFVIKQVNALGHIVEATYEPFYGNTISSKDVNGLITTNTYDGFGRPKETVTPIGQRISYTLGWTQGSETGRNENCLFYSKTTASTNNNEDFHAYEFFDMYARSIGTKSYALGNLPIITTTYYNKYGQTVQSRQPGPNTNRILAQNTYDALGRTNKIESYISTGIIDPVNLTMPTSNISSGITNTYDFSVSGEFTYITTDNNSRIVKKTFDNTGALIRATDPTNVIVNYTYNSQNQPVSINAAGAVTTINYDKYGRQYQLVDPDAGTSEFRYNSFNQLTKQTDGKGNMYELTYDKLGRVITKKETPNGSSTFNTYNYTYDTETHGKGMLASMSGGPDNMTTTYKYDNYSRNYQTTENFDGINFTTTYGFDNHGRISQITYPSGLVIKQSYSNLTNEITSITDDQNNAIWTLAEINNTGMVKKSILGNNGQFVKENLLNDLMMPLEMSFTTNIGSNNWRNRWVYNFDEGNQNFSKGNMYSRQNIVTKTTGFSSVIPRNLTETFLYDDNDRLLTISNSQPAVPMAITYNDNGTIATKTDALYQTQNYDYGGAAPEHAVKNISPLNETYKPLQKIEYTAFNKIAQIKEGDMNGTPEDFDASGNITQLDYKYGLDNERRKMTETKTIAGSVFSTRTKYYSANYEKEEISSQGVTTSREINYIFAPDGLAAIYEKKNGTGKYYYIATDGLGSINMIVNANDGTIASDMSYDAWGRRRNPYDWTYTNITTSNITNRGFTMHEMLDNFDLINMNGRAYDPLLGQFLSPDPLVSNPENPQSYNRYSYCLNNPLKYIDPSGYCDWKWFINQNLSSAALELRANRNYVTDNNNSFTRSFQQSLNAIRSYRDWDDKYKMFKDYYDSKRGIVEKVIDAMNSAYNYEKRKPESGKLVYDNENPDYLCLTYKNGESKNYTFVEEVTAKMFEMENNDIFWFMNYDSKNYGPPQNLLPDQITISLSVSSSFCIGGGYSYNLTYLSRGDDRGWHRSRTLLNKYGGEVDWGLTISGGMFHGAPSKATFNSLLGTTKSVSAYYICGVFYQGSFDSQNNLKWSSFGSGVGFSYGASYGIGPTLEGWW